MHSHSLLLVAGLALQALALPSTVFRDASIAPTVILDYATYQGSTDTAKNITSFLGVRYAAPPTGSLRFQSPRKPATVAGVQNATALPPQCYQTGVGIALTNPLLPLVTKREDADVATSEDCLFLDVVVPNFGSVSGLPVVVWIHGGGYVAGSASAQSQTDLTVDSGNQAIVVLIQYRLGVFGTGFLPGPEVKANGALNAGLRAVSLLLLNMRLDQNMALEWMQSHISKFGGDPTKVTIWGQSGEPEPIPSPLVDLSQQRITAGAGSVLQHIVANGGRTNPPLFRAAITSSTFLPPQYPGDGVIPAALYNEVASHAGCANATNTFTCLVGLDAAKLGALGNTTVVDSFFGTSAFVPVVDGKFIVERPTQTLKKGKLNGNVLLSMTNTFEGSIFVDANPPVTNITEYAQNLFPLLTPAQTTTVAKEYAKYSSTLPTVEDQAIAIMGEAIFICPTYYLLQAFKGTAYKGEFAISPGSHGEDLAYYFFSQGPTYDNAAFIASFSSAFLDTAISLNPNNHTNPASITPPWKPWNSVSGGAEMLFNETAAGAPDIRGVGTDAGLLARCAFWESITANTAQ
ncbi:alpha beta-hydrolase [Athelia psychrophila]|uniref:Alpha beta-hydrolase n=1 Tax=Athelia psychrophila TaxID=1759441 RepID=A0A166EZ78_9AGAM|nr:alpha beta-hydrolase [Fibularhizoctonia sp. CBS 109695]